MTERSYAVRVIGTAEEPAWRAKQFLREEKIVSEKLIGAILLPEVLPGLYINQNGNVSFVEFENKGVVDHTGYSAEEMRSHGCGISVLHMCLGTLSDNYQKTFKSVGALAIHALSHHRNDFVVNGVVTRVGTPVFNLKTGWYHDALVHTAIETTQLDVFRLENLQGMEEIVVIANGLINDGKCPLVILSVKNKFWRLKNEPESMMTHLVIVNGFNFDNDGNLKEIRVTDPFALNQGKKLNQWVEVNERVREAFTGRAIFVVGEDEN